jgi:hypothetical protein
VGSTGGLGVVGKRRSPLPVPARNRTPVVQQVVATILTKLLLFPEFGYFRCFIYTDRTSGFVFNKHNMEATF